MRAAGETEEVNPTSVPSPPDRTEEVLRLRQEAAEQAAQNARLEMLHLKKLLAEQENARRHAQKTAAYAHRQLKVFEEDSRRVRDELTRTREQLTLVKQEQNIERQQSSVREATLKSELLDARTRASTAQDSASGYRKKGLVIAFGLLLPAIVWAAVTYWHPGGSSTDSHASAPATSASTSAPATTAPPVASHDFTGALSRLDDALGNFKGVANPEDILRAVHKENAANGIHVCSFEWNNGQISLSFGNKEDADPQIAVARCADAVEKFAAKK